MRTQNGMQWGNRWLGATLALLFSALLVIGGDIGSARADLITLSDLNSTVQIDPHSADGMYEWKVDGVNHLKEQWFWYRIGDDVDFDYETSIDALDTLFSPVVETLLSGRDLRLTYRADLFDLEISYTLTGGTAGSGMSDIAESIRVINTSDDVLPFRFFQYSDFDLNETPDDDTVKLTNANTITQSDPLGVLSETVITPAGDHWQIALAPTIRDFLDDLDLNDLNDTVSPLGPDDIEWAWEWIRDIPGNGSFLISKDKQIRPYPVSIPEPSGLVLIGLGMVGLFGFEKVRRGKKS